VAGQQTFLFLSISAMSSRPLIMPATVPSDMSFRFFTASMPSSAHQQREPLVNKKISMELTWSIDIGIKSCTIKFAICIISEVIYLVHAYLPVFEAETDQAVVISCAQPHTYNTICPVLSKSACT
jgi:hypothetical protein